MAEKKHNLNEEYLNSLTREQRLKEMKEWTSEEWANYHCPNGTMTLEEFSNLLDSKIKERFEKLNGSNNQQKC